MAGNFPAFYLYMSRYHSYINTAVKIIESYKGEMPFSIFVKQFFAAEKKYGSNDRKQIAGLCYNYYRLGFAVKTISIENKILLAYFLCNNDPSALMQKMNTEWNEMIELPLNEKLEFLKDNFSSAAIFPFKNELSSLIDEDLFNASFLIQPDLYLRIRALFKKDVVQKISASNLCYTLLNDNCIQLPPSTKVESLLDIDKEVVVQDYNSQKVLNWLNSNYKANSATSVWDCCAASGGKSILAWDILNGKVELTVSDIRESIIANLQQRFKKAAIKSYKYFTADIENDNLQSMSAGRQVKAGDYDIIICDAPCTGSGTWGRTPEQLIFFNPASIDEYSNRQKKIAGNAMPHLKKDGLFFYITCSVFKKENEDVVSYIKEQHNLKLLDMQLLKGYDKKADSMFVAVFKKQ